MLKIQEIRELIKLVDQSTLEEFEYEFEDSKIKMKKNGGEVVPVQVVQPAKPVAAAVEQKVQAVEAAPAKPVEKVEEKKVETAAIDAENLHKVVSPMVGTFYQSPSPDAEAYVKKGSKVTKDSIVCIVEAMKLFNEIEAEVNGEIVEVLVSDGQLVEYGQPLFLVKPE
jgi:acetyl-CoA carboxylase biotin carboxyl carrier protein